MKYKALVIIGVCLILAGYGMMEAGGRVTHVTCERTESSFLPVCHLSEYFLGLFPSRPTETVTEITALSQTGKVNKDYYLVQRLESRKLAPVNLNRVVTAGKTADDEPLASLNRLAKFFRSQDDSKVEVTLTNEAGNVPVGILFFVTGIALVLFLRVDHQLRKPKSTTYLE